MVFYRKSKASSIILWNKIFWTTQTTNLDERKYLRYSIEVYDLWTYSCLSCHDHVGSWWTATAALAASLSLFYSRCLSEARRNFSQTMNQQTQPCGVRNHIISTWWSCTDPNRVATGLTTRWRHVGNLSKVVGYYGARVCRYANSDSTFQLIRVVISGNVSENLKPTVKKPAVL